MSKLRCVASMALLALVSGLAWGCGSPPAPPPRGDAGPRVDAGGMDAGTMDAGDVDGGSGDAGTDGGILDDAGPEIDGGSSDAGGGTDAGIPDASDPPTDSGIDFCALLPAGTPCPCASGFTCLPNGCGEMRCYPAGRACLTAADCASGSSCTANVCTRGSGCGDSRDCPPGYACETGSCVDRRIGCGPGAPCPWGFLCDNAGEGRYYCLRAQTRCDDSAACPLFGQCRDVLGMGSKICHWSSGPMCQNNIDCPVIGEVCGVHPEFVDALCGNYGPCSSVTDCASGFICTDLWGDGITECVPSGGSCTQTSDCTAPAICASPLAGGPPTCMLRPL